MAALLLLLVLLLLQVLHLLLRLWEKQPPQKQRELHRESLRLLYQMLYKLPLPKRWKQHLFLNLLKL